MLYVILLSLLSVCVDGYVSLSFNKTYGADFEKSNKERVDITRLNRRGSYKSIDIINQNSFYSIELDIGTPKQTVTVLLDTGSADLWLVGDNNPYCIKHGGGIDCKTFGIFSSKKSSTYSSNNTFFSIMYGDGTTAIGEWCQDVLYLSDMNITGLSFGISNESNSTVGVLGIGYPELEVTYSGNKQNDTAYMYNNFPIQLRNNGNLESNAFSLFLNTYNAENGTILFGAVDHSKYIGNLTTVPLINTLAANEFSKPIQFEITMNGLGINTGSEVYTLTTTRIPALLDSGTSLMYLPQQLLDSIALAISATYQEDNGYHTVSCGGDTTYSYDDMELMFNFNGMIFNSSITNYLVPIGKDVCILGIMPSPEKNRVILGDLFLSSAYVVYDLDNYEISIAPTTMNNNNTHVEIILNSVPGATRANDYFNTWTADEPLQTGGDMFAGTNYSFTFNKLTSSISPPYTTAPSLFTTNNTYSTDNNKSHRTSSAANATKAMAYKQITPEWLLWLSLVALI